MRLSGFIESNIESILADWDAFARTNAPTGSDMTDLALRDHAEEILLTIARDIETAQSEAEQFDKSQGLSDSAAGRCDAAALHGSLRHQSGFSLVQLSAEYRALRATVLRQWLPTLSSMDADTMQEMVRFNEAIDQAFADSVLAFEERASSTRELFLAILGHDLRSPLATAEMVGTMMSRHQLTARQVGELGGRLERSTRLMKRMVSDLIGFTRIRLGADLPISPRACHLVDLLQGAMADAQASYPTTDFELQLADAIDGHWDADRLHQLFMNLMVNAVQHGAPGKPVVVHARRQAHEVVVDVTNFGKPIQPQSLESIFKPLVQHPPSHASTSHPTGSLGLGLYIAREIAERHGGTVVVSSSDAHGTTFRVTLPLSTQHQPKEQAVQV